MPRLAPLIVVLVVVGVGTATPPRGTAAAKPCWERVFDDWLDDGTIDGTYGVACYEAALKHVPEDLREYTDITAAISVALQRALRPSGPIGPDSTGGAAGLGDGFTPNSAPANTAKGGGVARTEPRRSVYLRGLDSLGTTRAESVPLPLIVLGGLGGALLISAAGLALRKRLKAREPPKMLDRSP